jgi:N-succinyldiaminopimelate aminotransferase
MSALARRHGAIDLGSGTPDGGMPDLVRQAVFEAIERGRNQYSPVAGESELRRAVAAHAARFYDQSVDPMSEITITSGVTEGIYAACTSLLEADDEVIVFEPFYDSYVPSIQLAGGHAVPVTLMAPDFRLDPAELRAAISPRTRALILNNPHNPTGRVFSFDELMTIAALCREFDLLAIVDEVYEHIVFDDRRHIRLATLPGMWQRTLTLSGASKTFSCTGWRIGWAIGPGSMQEALNTFRQFNVFCAATPLQLGIAEGLGLPDGYFAGLAKRYCAGRNAMIGALGNSCFRAFRPEGAFFALASFADDEYETGRACCESLARDAGVVPIPLDSFYLDPRRVPKMIRFTYCQSSEILMEAGRRLSASRRVVA